MDGQSLNIGLANLLQESLSSSSFLNTRASYDLFYDAALEFVRRSMCLTATTTITTVKDQASYDLPHDYLGLWATDDRNQPYIKFNDGVADYFVTHRDYDKVLFANQTTSVPVPQSFSIIDQQTLTSRITGAATATGAVSNGEATLTDAAAPFANVQVGDEVHNTTLSYDGIVISKTSSSALVTAMFSGTGAAVGWTITTDNYVIVPQAKFSIVLDPPPDDDGDTVTVYYVQKPEPVYSPYRTYRIDPQYKMALIMYAGWLYKYSDREPNFGDKWFQHFDNATRKAIKTYGRSKNKISWKFNKVKRTLGDRSWR
jgi:hypothetical protein